MKNDPSELVIANIVVMTEITIVKQLSKKTWEEMAKHGNWIFLKVPEKQRIKYILENDVNK